MPSLFPGLRRLLLVCALAGGLASTAAAQPAVHLRGNVGASFFQSPGVEQDLLNSGTDLGLAADIRVYRGLSVSLQGTYDQFTLNQENAQILSGGGQFRAGDLSLLGGSLGVRYTLQNDSDAHPYVLAGVGLYRGQQTDSQFYGAPGGDEPAATKTSIQRGFHLALGSNFRLDDTYAVFVEPRFTFIEGKSDGFLISTQDTETPRYFTLRLGLDVRLW
jgi:opacity protein-like surface antigen